MSFDFAIVGIAGHLSDSQIKLRAKYPESRIKRIKALEAIKPFVKKHKYDEIKVLRCL